jgi:hypothetical protein
MVPQSGWFCPVYKNGTIPANSPYRDPAFTGLAIMTLEISPNVFLNRSEHRDDRERPAANKPVSTTRSISEEMR